MFMFKKIVGPCFDPLSVCLALLIAGLLLLWFTKKQRLGKVLVSIGLVVLVLASYGWFSAPFVRPLESKFPALMQVNTLPEIKWIIVLGGGVAADKSIPANIQLSDASLARLIEGVRLHNALPQTRLLLSGGFTSGPISEAEAMEQTASFLGVDKQKMLLDSESKDTEDQARLIKNIVGNDRFILVTSASHMPRSVALVKKLGLHPIPAPADRRVIQGTGTISPRVLFPNSANITMIEMAMHEYLGIVWGKMRGRI